MKKLGGMDASFLYMETPQTPMHVASLSIVELPAGFKGSFYDDYKAHLARRLHLVPVLLKKLMQVPWDIDHPVWVDDEDMDLAYHIRHLGLPRPGTMQQLEELVGRLHSNFLDRSRPLWEFYVIDGLAGNRVAIYIKIHHAAVDGGAGMALMHMMYDVSPVPRQVDPPPPKPEGKGSSPEGLALLGAAYKNMLSQQVNAITKIPDVLKAIASLVTPAIRTRSLQLKGLPTLSAPKTMLNTSITSQRAFTARSVSLAEAKAIAKKSETKLNDVVMAICAGALRRYLLEKQSLPNEPLIAFVPVSLREAGNADFNNQVSGMLVGLATDVDNPNERLKAIHASSVAAKDFTGKIKDATPRDFSLLGSPLLLQGAIGLFNRSGLADHLRPPANVVISNVPGPQAPFYVAGAKVLTLYPVSIPAHGMALNMTVQSYMGALDFGLTACRRTVPGLTLMADYLVESLEELRAAVLGEAGGVLPAQTAQTAQKVRARTPKSGGLAAKASKPSRLRATSR